MVSFRPLSRVVPLISGRFMAYKWGILLTTYESWDDPPSRRIPFCHDNRVILLPLVENMTDFFKVFREVKTHTNSHVGLGVYIVYTNKNIQLNRKQPVTRCLVSCFVGSSASKTPPFFAFCQGFLAPKKTDVTPPPKVFQKLSGSKNPAPTRWFRRLPRSTWRMVMKHVHQVMGWSKYKDYKTHHKNHTWGGFLPSQTKRTKNPSEPQKKNGPTFHWC